MDGLLYPNRTPHTGLKEWKNAARPVRAQWKSDDIGRVTLKNCLDFTNLRDAVTLRYEVTQDGAVTQSGTCDLPSILPHTEAELNLPLCLPRLAPAVSTCITCKSRQTAYTRSGKNWVLTSMLYGVRSRNSR